MYKVEFIYKIYTCAYLELDDSLIVGLTTAVTRLIRRGNCPAMRFLVGILFETSGSFSRPEEILH